ncbi:uncharacterized protein J4E79_006013 [Alternaria viburni]|uniref:uncharacterized protein n=1 Tax=Alternaria viburni TaxID=566460 RepID=UPI0020C51576|nr:uncharacterized protein J4E79_006013 [Alternaria viburni]KAI4660208.1 hypothetical protein J4E79_006013 [Alternaria viburni]
MAEVATLFNEDWEFQRSGQTGWSKVHLPHDAMQVEGRREDALAGTHGGFYLGGTYKYRKTWQAPTTLESKVVALSFDGVYRHSRVLVNGTEVGGCLAGWTKFEVRVDSYLKLGERNTIEVHADNSEQPNARWYTGAGIHRSVHLMVRNHNLLCKDGIRLATLSASGVALLTFEVLLNNEKKDDVEVSFELSRGGRNAIQWTTKTTTSELRQNFELSNPDLWSAETPNLYDCTVVINGDLYKFKYGLRTLQLKPGHGFLVNGQTVKLRGGCIHADNGILGAASFKAAELRRVSIMKKNGFNAIRMSHHPCSEVLLQACDEVGMYVMDEFADYWYQAKSKYDDSNTFNERWEYEVASLVERARNHPSVVMYSLGNEITEPKSAYGHTIAKKLLDLTHKLDPSRPNTIALNLTLALMMFSKIPPGDPNTPPADNKGGLGDLASSTFFNIIASMFLSFMRYFPKFNHTNVVTSRLYSYMDVAGYNYGDIRYQSDAKLHPSRMMLGTETCPPDLPRNWSNVEKIPNLIGDFMWTGWDYLGEVGIGVHDYEASRFTPIKLYKPWPHLVGGCGALDITGVPNASAFVAQACWKLLSQPVIAVRPLDVSNLYYKATPWRDSDAIEGWGWKGCEGQKAYIEVITQEEETELFLNGRSLGRASSNQANRYTARFSTAYEPGELLAVAYSRGQERSRSTLRSADVASVRIVNEKSGELVADRQDLAYLELQLADQEGNIEMNDDDTLTVEVHGDATLAALGSAYYKNLHDFKGNVHRTWRGRALAVIRSGSTSGDVVVTVSSVRHGSSSITIKQRAQE